MCAHGLAVSRHENGLIGVQQLFLQIDRDRYSGDFRDLRRGGVSMPQIADGTGCY
jgi:hypothetical protein